MASRGVMAESNRKWCPRNLELLLTSLITHIEIEKRRRTYLLSGLEEDEGGGVRPAGDGRHEGRVAARVLRGQQRLEVRPEDGALAHALQGGQRGGAAVLAVGGGGRRRALLTVQKSLLAKKNMKNWHK